MSRISKHRFKVPNVEVGVRAIETRLNVAAAQGIGPDQQAAADGARTFLRKAEEAAHGVDPPVGRIARWWAGASVDAAYQNLHAARVQMVDVYDEADLAAEIPGAIARAQQTMHRDDPRRASAVELAGKPVGYQRAFLRHAIADGYASMDRQYERVRSFRNIILLLAVSVIALVVTTVLVVWRMPSVMPLCFDAPAANAPALPTLNCPSGTGVAAARGTDIFIVALLGLLGGALAAAVSIRNLRGTSTPYDVPVALSFLKVPLGAFTAVLGLVAVRGEFVPGLTALDSQQQILAYALVLGYGQQIFTFSLDRRAQSLLDGLPTKDASTPLQEAAAGSKHTGPPPPPDEPPSGPSSLPSDGTGSGLASLGTAFPSPSPSSQHTNGHGSRVPAPTAEASTGAPVAVLTQDRPDAPSADEQPVTDLPVTDPMDLSRDELEYQPAPPTDGDDIVQDDGSPAMPNPQMGDHS